MAQLEEGDDAFLELAAALDADEDGDDQASPTAPPGASSGVPGGGGGNRLSWAAKAAAAGAAGAIPLGHKPRHAVLLPPGTLPCFSAYAELTGQPAAAAEPSSKVAVFGAGPTAARNGGLGASGAGAGGFSDVGQGTLVERYAGLKIKNPRVSHTQLRGRLADVAVLRLAQVRQRHRTAGLQGSWATICVVGEKSKPRETAGGRAFSIWKVTDLDQTCLSLFLFSNAHGDLWKEPEGTLVALFSPKVRPEGDFSLSVDSAEQVWVLGHSPEFGHCKAKKKNGEPCRMPVNVARCPFCPYHVQSEYNRLKPTGRNEFQGTNLKTAFRPGMQRGLQWAPGDFETAAAKQARLRSLPANQLAGVATSARDRGSAAGARYLTTVANPTAAAAAEAAAARRLTPAAAIAAAARLGPTAAALAAAPIPAGRSTGALVLQLAQPSKQGRQQRQVSSRKRAAAAAAAGRDGGKRRGRGGAAAPPNRAAVAEGEEGGGDMVELESEAEAEESTAAGSGGAGISGGGYDPTAAARQRALELLRAAGGARAPDPNRSGGEVPAVLAVAAERARAARREAIAAAASGPPRLSPAAAGAAAARPADRTALAAVQGRRPPPPPSVVGGGPGAPRPPPPACRPQGQPAAGSSAARSKPPAAKAAAAKAAAPQSAMEAAFGGVLQEADLAAAAAKGTRYKELVEDEEFEKLDKVLSVLEQKDEMAARMEAVTRLTVQAFRCKLCGYTAERRRPQCAAHPHAVERVEATKRWWRCEGCSYRFTTVGLRYPAGRCAKCNQPGTEFAAVSMLRPTRQHELQQQQSGVAGREQLLARGNEQKWANSW